MTKPLIRHVTWWNEHRNPKDGATEHGDPDLLARSSGKRGRWYYWGLTKRGDLIPDVSIAPTRVNLRVDTSDKRQARVRKHLLRQSKERR